MANQTKSYRKFVASAATATLVASALVPVASAAPANTASVFTDVPSQYAESVDYLVDNKLTVGKTPTQFGTYEPILRVDAAVWIARAALGEGEIANAKPSGFTDVRDNARNFVDALHEHKIVSGKNETQFGSYQNITRGEAAIMLAKAYNLVGDVENVTFTDVAPRYKDAVAALVDNEITSGKKNNRFGTDDSITRAELAVWVHKLEVQKDDPTPETPSGIQSVTAINDTRVEVKFGEAIDKDFIREAERSGKYFAIYTEGNTVESSIQSENVTFSSDGKTAYFDLEGNNEVESGKKYYVVLLDGDNPVVADIKYSYGPAELKAAAATPGFDVSALSDKIYVKFSSKMKDSAKDVANYTVFDEGGQELGPLSEFIAEDSEGKWTNLNDKKEVEFKLATDSEKHFLAGKVYKLVVDKGVQTDDNKTLAEAKRTVKVKTPSVDEASPVANVARVTGDQEVTIIFDQDISGENLSINPAQLDLRTSTGKTVNVESVNAEIVNDNALKLTFTGDTLDSGTTYRVNIPANVVQNGIFPNAMNKATTGLKAEAQENKSIASMKAQIVANAKKADQADLILTFDQVPNLETLDAQDIALFDGRDKYLLDGTDATQYAKVYGGDSTGKSIIIEDVSQFEHDTKGQLDVRGDKSYEIEIGTGKLATDSFASDQATNKSKLVASTKGVSIAAPIVDEVRLESAEKIVLEFKENIAGTLSASDLEVAAFVADRSDIFNGSEAKKVSGSGYYDVKVSGKTITITAKTGTKFVTGLVADNVDSGVEDLVSIKADKFTNASGKVGNKEIKLSFNEGTSDETTQFIKHDDVVDNAAPVIVGAQIENATTSDDKVTQDIEFTFSEAVNIEDGNIADANEKLGALFFANKGENATEGIDFNSSSYVVTFNNLIAKDSTDLSIITVKYTQGNTYYIEDMENNKMATQTITGITAAGTLDTPQ